MDGCVLMERGVDKCGIADGPPSEDPLYTQPSPSKETGRKALRCHLPRRFHHHSGNFCMTVSSVCDCKSLTEATFLNCGLLIMLY